MSNPRIELVTGIDRLVVPTPPNKWCDEASVVANPANLNNVIAAAGIAKRSLTVSYSLDGGITWANSSLPDIPDIMGFSGLARPVLDFGADGTAYLLATGGTGQIFRSMDGGATWTAKPVGRPSLRGFACDPKQPGRLYVTSTHYDKVGELTFLRSGDFGETWTGTALRVEEGMVPSFLLFPHISVADSGTIHIAGWEPFQGGILHWHSENGGENFTFQRATGRLSGTGTTFSYPMMNVSGCIAGDDRFVVAWADSRDGVTRIYHRVTDEGGLTWAGPSGGTPLLPTVPATSNAHHLCPRLAVTDNGVLGCAFYEFKEENGEKRMNLLLAPSFAVEDGFEEPIAVSDSAWDPEAGAPEGMSAGDLVGQYFGFAADASSFLVLWPDTRTGAQILYFDRVQVQGPRFRPSWHSEDTTVYITSEQWLVIARRHGEIINIIRHPPGGPAGKMARALRELEAPAALEGAKRISDPRVARAVRQALDEIEDAFAADEKEQPRRGSRQ